MPSTKDSQHPQSRRSTKRTPSAKTKPRKRTKAAAETPTDNPNRGAVTSNELGHFRVRYMGTMGDRFDGRFNPAGAQPIPCALNETHGIGAGEYYTEDAGGRPVCRVDRPFELVTES